MKKCKTFSLGGLFLPKHKISQHSPIEDAGVPEYVHIPIKQHIGSPAKVLVSRGDRVKIGTLLADFDGVVSSDVHSSVCGVVEKIEEQKTDTGYFEVMITIKTEADEFEKNINTSDDVIAEITLSVEEIKEIIKASGIVGMGGAGFPTPIKTSIPEGKSVDTLIINGIECEPYLTADDRLMVERAEEVVIGAKIINKILGIQNALIAIDENKKNAIEILSRICKRYVGVNVVVCKTKYPQGAEKQLIEAIKKVELPLGKLPVDVGCLVQNVGTVFAVYEAVQKNKPLYERIVSVSGDMVGEPKNLRVRVGTPASFLYEKCGGLENDIGQVIFGGPMMGKSLVNLEAPVTKLTSGVLLMSHKMTDKPQEDACIRCGKCSYVCCMGLEPFYFSSLLRANEVSQMNKLNVLSCIECGSCSYVCPAKIPLLDYVKLGKKAVRKTQK